MYKYILVALLCAAAAGSVILDKPAAAAVTECK